MATCADQPISSSSGHAAGTERGFAGPVRTGARGFRTLVDVTHAKVAIGCHRVVRVMSAFRDTPDRPLVSARGFTVEVAEVNTSEGDETPRAGYRRSAGSPRGEARRRELLDRVTEDLAVNGLVDFSLAACRAGSGHHAQGAALPLRRRRRPAQAGDPPAARQAHRQGAGHRRRRSGPARTLADWVRAVWPILVGEEARVLDQAIGLAMYDPDALRGTRPGRVAAVPALAAVALPGALVRPAQARGRRDDPRDAAGLPGGRAGPAATPTGSPPGSRPWPARWTARRPPASSRLRRTAEGPWTRCEPRGSLLRETKTDSWRSVRCPCSARRSDSSAATRSAPPGTIRGPTAPA